MKSTVMSKLTELINKEVMKQLAENYHELLPHMVKIDVDHIEEDMSFAVGAVYFTIANRVIFIPAIYREGQVDSVSYIGDVENDKLYALTKKMYRKLISGGKIEFGKVMSEKEQERLMIDQGVIGRLFATPQTMSPKVAGDMNYHDSVIMSLLEDDKFATQFEKLAESSGYKAILGEIYAPAVFEKLASVQSRRKLATSSGYKNTQTITKIAELHMVPKGKRAEAGMAIATHGFYKVASEPKKEVIKEIPTLGEQLLKTKSTLEIVSTPGIYNMLDKNLDMIPVVAARRPDGRVTLLGNCDRVTVASSEGPITSAQVVGIPAAAINGDPRMHISQAVDFVPANEATSMLIIGSTHDIDVYPVMQATSIGDSMVVEAAGCTAEINSKFSYLKRGTNIYVHPNHVVFFKPKATPKRFLLGADDLDSAFVKTASVEVVYSAGSYRYKDSIGSKQVIAEKLDSDGFSREAIGEMLKTAAEQPQMPAEFQEISQTLKAILAEITQNKHTLVELQQAMMAGNAQQDPEAEGEAAPEQQTEAPQDGGQDGGQEEQIQQQIAQIAQSVGLDPATIISQGQSQGMDLPTILQSLQQEMQGMQAQAGGEQQAQEQKQQQMPPQAQEAMSEGGEDPEAQGQAQPMPGQGGEQQALQEQGYNTNMSPEMLQQLREIADKDVLNASIISYLVDSADAKPVVTQYLADIDKGVNGLARTLLLIEIQKGAFVEQMGEKQLTTFISRGKTLLSRMTDFMLDTSVID